MPKAMKKTGGSKERKRVNEQILETEQIEQKEQAEQSQDSNENPSKSNNLVSKQRKRGGKVCNSPRKLGKSKSKSKKANEEDFDVAAIFEEDDNVVEMETEGMTTEFMSKDSDEEDNNGDLQLAMQLSRNNNATKVGELKTRANCEKKTCT